MTMATIQIRHDREHFMSMLSYAVSRENLWGNVDILTCDREPGMLLVLRDQINLGHLVSTESVYASYKEALAELGSLLDEVNPDQRPLSHL